MEDIPLNPPIPLNNGESLIFNTRDLAVLDTVMSWPKLSFIDGLLRLRDLGLILGSYG